MGLKDRIIHGILWNVSGSIATQVLGMLTKIFLARILFPADFGLFAMVIVGTQFLGLFVGFGLSSAVIYKKEELEKTLSTALLLSVSAGFILASISFFSSSFVAQFFHEPALTPMIRLVSIIFILDSFSTILYAGLVKNLHFKRKACVDIFAAIINSIIVIILALQGYGAWSLIIAYIIQHILQAIALLVISPIKIQFSFDKDIAKEIGHFGKYALTTSIAGWMITSIDNIIVGRKIGDEGLGYYSFSFNIATLPVLSLTHMITGVFHPVFAKVREDKEKLKEAYLKPLEWSLVLILPFSAGLFLLADSMVHVLFGEKWIAIIPLLQIFALYSIFRTVCTIISHLFEGIGKPKTASMLLAIELCLLVIILFPLINSYGLIGTAYAVVIARGISMILHIIRLHKDLPVSCVEYLRVIAGKVVATGIMSIAVLLLQTVFAGQTALNLFFFIIMGMLVYTVSLFMLDKKLFIEIRELLKGISY